MEQQPQINENLVISVLDSYRQYLTREDKSNLTVKGYIDVIIKFDQYFFNIEKRNMSFKDLTFERIKAYREYLYKTLGRKVTTINRILSAIKNFCYWSAGEKYLSLDQVGNVKLIKEQHRPKPKKLDRNCQNALIRAIDKASKRDRALIAMLFFAGVRVTELCEIRVRNLQLSSKKGSVEVLGKGSKHREIPINADGRRRIYPYFAQRLEEVSLNKYGPGGGEHLFIGQRGPMTPEGIRFVLKKWANNASVKGVNGRTYPHLLRHNFAHALIDSGVGLEKVAELMGHADMNTTKRYTMPSQEDLIAAVESFRVDEDVPVEAN